MSLLHLHTQSGKVLPIIQVLIKFCKLYNTMDIKMNAIVFINSRLEKQKQGHLSLSLLRVELELPSCLGLMTLTCPVSSCSSCVCSLRSDLRPFRARICVCLGCWFWVLVGFFGILSAQQRTENRITG